MTDERRRFTVISNIEAEEDREIRERQKEQDRYRKARGATYQTNPLREQFMRFTNEEAGRRFTVEDLLKW